MKTARQKGLSRRGLLLGGSAAAGALLVGWAALPPRSRQGKGELWPLAAGEVALNGWIKIGADGRVVLAMPRSEMGQGIHTALAMLVAEELDLPMSLIRLEQAGRDSIFGNVAMLVSSLPLHPLESEGDSATWSARAAQWMVAKVARELGINATGGSSSVADAWEPVRAAAATARAALLGAAAAQWKLAVGELAIVDGVVTHPSGQRAHFGELAKAAASTPPGVVTLKPQRDFKLLGRPTPRLDVPDKVNGAARFGIDVRPAGLVYAALRMSPVLGGSPGAIANADEVLSRVGVERIVRLPAYAGGTAGVAVVARSYWQASQAVRTLAIDWRADGQGELSTEAIEQALWREVDSGDGHVFYKKGDAANLLGAADGARLVQADYFAPYLAHASMEPMNATAQVTPGAVEVWAPTQVPSMAAGAAARVAGRPVEQVRVHVTQLGGGFGRRLETDVVAQAVRLAMECGGRPVQLIWSREEDFTHDFYRPMQVARLRARLDANGHVLAMETEAAGDAITPRWIGRNMPSLAAPVDTPDKSAAEGLFDMPYDIAHQSIRHVATRQPVPVGFWRAVGHSHNAFFVESFMDELAQAAGVDPLAWRRRLLGRAPRHLAVLDQVAAKARWGEALPAGRARGLALHESFGSVAAVVCEVSQQSGSVFVHRVVCAIDCGQVLNPQTVTQQMESCVVFGLSAALHGNIHIEGGRVQGDNFPAHPILGLAQAPEVQTVILPSVRPPSGVGEVGLPPVAPAVANAWYALTGQRQRRLPLLQKS